MENDIAVIGIGCRFPGADNKDEFWRVLVNGENHVTDIPPERWNNDAFYSENKGEPGKHYVRKAGFITRHDEWDNKLFGISDVEAARVDPQQRYVLECSHMALEDAGLTRKHVSGSQTGVFIGVMNDDYKGFSEFDHTEDTNYTATGMSSTLIASRVSYNYNLQGPCMVLDTACSSSLIAIHLGSQSIRAGECELAICGGVNSILRPDPFIPLCKAGMLTPSGQCQSFCDTADGYARSEGCGIVIIKPYKKAMQDNNKIWGIVRTGTNQDGQASQPITAPSGDQQHELFKKIYTQYKVNPVDLQYIEAHGTGTPTGDPTEVNALGMFISSYRLPRCDINGNTHSYLAESSIMRNTIQTGRERDTTCIEENENEKGNHMSKYKVQRKILLGSVKSNIGHTEPAAGVAGLIKVLLMMKNGQVVPTLHVLKDKSNVNKKIRLDEYGLELVLETSKWGVNKDGLRIGCVNSFGFGGSNCHAIVIQGTNDANCCNKIDDKRGDNKYYVICISALDTLSLKAALELLHVNIETGNCSLEDVSFTSVYHRNHYSNRTLVFGKNVTEVREQIKSKAANIKQLSSQKKIRLIFVFCGVGTTWKGMCREMIEKQPVFADTICRIDKHLQPLTGWRMMDILREDTDFNDPLLNHVAIFCTQMGLFELWKSWNILPHAIIGQSVGEVAAAYASGALSLEDAVSVIYYRSKILSEKQGGKMMVVSNIEVEKIEKLCQKYKLRVTIAVYNSPISCTLSGDADVIDSIKNELQEMNSQLSDNILIFPLNVRCAYHSHHLDTCLPVIERQLDKSFKYDPGPMHVDHFSTVTGKIANKEFQTGKYWAENIRKPVQFMTAIRSAASDSVANVYLEIGPKQVLRAHLKDILGDKRQAVCFPSMNKGKECESVYNTLSTLYELGADIKWKNVVAETGKAINVPQSDFKKTKHLLIPKSKLHLLKKGYKDQSSAHMFIRETGSSSTKYSIQLDINTTPFVYDHYYCNHVIVPGSLYVEAAFAIGQSISDLREHELCVSTEFVNMFFPQKDIQYSIDLAVTQESKMKMTYFTVTNDGKCLCKGYFAPRKIFQRSVVDIASIKSRCGVYRNREDSYECLDELNLRYGDTLSLITCSWSSGTECLVDLCVPEKIKRECRVTHLHPSVTDALFQTFGILSAGGVTGPALPKTVGSVVINGSPRPKMYGYSQLVKSTPKGMYFNSLLLSEDGDVLAEIQDFYAEKLGNVNEASNDLIYEVIWKERGQTEDKYESSSNNNSSIVFGSTRFVEFVKLSGRETIKCITLANDSADNEDLYSKSLQDFHTAKAILFAPCYQKNNDYYQGSTVYKICRENFLNLALLLKVMRKTGLKIPIVVITEGVQAVPSSDISATNMFGSEVWGLVRSAMHEAIDTDLRIVDMRLTDDNLQALELLVQDNDRRFNEYLICCGTIYQSEFIAIENQAEMMQREIIAYKNENLVLKSSCPTYITAPHFEIQTDTLHSDAIQLNYEIDVESVTLHDPALYPVCTTLSRTRSEVWPQNIDKTFTVVCLEGVGHVKNGYENRKEKKTIKVGFCHPVDVTSFVSIPQKCTFDFKSLPVYIPGMMSVGVILWNVVTLCAKSSRTYVIVEKSSSNLGMLIACLFEKHKTSMTVVQLDGISEVVNIKHASTIAVLTVVTSEHIEKLSAICQNTKKFISIEAFIPREFERLLKHRCRKTDFHILKTEQCFSTSKLTETIPKLVSWYRSLDSSVSEFLKDMSKPRNCEQNENKVLQMPYPVLKIKEANDYCFPLKVEKDAIFRKTGCYVVTGGLSGLGWELVKFIAELGAGYIATISRRLPKAEKEKEIKYINNQYGCRIVALQADVSDINQLQLALKDLQKEVGNVRVRGVFHGAGVTCDRLLENMTTEDLDKVLLPKILGTWNMHVCTKSMPLDFFVMHSSIVSVVGNKGQCNYGAGNAFLDTFAHYRRNLGLCGQSINWGALAVGMGVESKTLEAYLRSVGFVHLNVEQIRTCFIWSLMANSAQVTFGCFDWNKFQANSTMIPSRRKFAGVLNSSETLSEKIPKKQTKFSLTKFYNLNEGDKRKAVENLVMSTVLGTFVIDDSTINSETEFIELGMDSMVSMSFTNEIFQSTHVRVPFTKLISDTTTIGTLTDYIVKAIPSKPFSDTHTHIQTEEIGKSNNCLQGNITFMQRYVLDNYVKGGNQILIYQLDFQTVGLHTKLSDWRIILNHLLSMNPELRRIYVFNENETYDSKLLPSTEVEVDLEEVDFESICNENDDRPDIIFDLCADLPIKFRVGFSKNKIRVRTYCHMVAGDLQSFATIFREIGSYLRSYTGSGSLPVKETNIVPAALIKQSLESRMSDSKGYWKGILNQDIQPFTLAETPIKELDFSHWRELSRTLPTSSAKALLKFLQNEKITLYNFLVSAYMATLYERTGTELIPLVTFADMRGHIPELKSIVTRCVNYIPILGDLREMETVSKYLKDSSYRLNQMTEHGAYPFELIKEEIQAEHLKKHIWRHLIVMDNMTSLHELTKDKEIEISMHNIRVKINSAETALYVMYDTRKENIVIEFGYNNQCIGVEKAESIMLRFVELSQLFITHQNAAMKDILKKPFSPQSERVSSHNNDGDIIESQLLNNKHFVRGNGKTRLSYQEWKGKMSLGNENSTGDKLQNTGVLLHGTFANHSNQDWEDEVLVTIVRSGGVFVLRIQGSNGSFNQELLFSSISDVTLKRLHGVFHILIKHSNKWISLQTNSTDKANTWVSTLKDAVMGNTGSHKNHKRSSSEKH